MIFNPHKYFCVSVLLIMVALVVKNLLASAEDVKDAGLIPGLGRSPGEGKGYPLQYFGLENSMGYIVPLDCKESDRTE